MNPREELKRHLFESRGGLCEGQAFRPHECRGGLEMHEVLLKRNDLPKKQQAYLWNEINCALVCGWFHALFAGSTAYTEWWQIRQGKRYGWKAVLAYMVDAPLKVRNAR